MMTGVYAAVFAASQVLMVFWIVRSRFKEKVAFGDGGTDVLIRKTRTYGNFTEVVPMALILMLCVELGSASIWVVHAMGGMMVLSRIMHVIGMMYRVTPNKYRMVGMILTMCVFLTGAVTCVMSVVFL